MINWISTHIPAWFFIAFVVHGVVLGSVAYLILLERKVASWVQDRIGPNRVGLGFGIIPFLKDLHMFGLGQPLADGLKFIVKEDYRPKNVDKILFTLAPGVMIVVVILSIAVIPWGGIMQSTATVDVSGVVDKVTAARAALPRWDTVVGDPVISGNTATVTYRYAFQIADLNIGVLFVLATLSLAVYGVVIGGWASNNKYSFLGGLRATANMISYEIPMGLAILAIVTMYGSLDLGTIVTAQAHMWGHFVPAWNVFCQPLAFIMFLVCIHAEANRAPFDVAEAEQELVGGYHTEYSSMRFALFFLAEYAGMITTSAVCVALFFGGWHLPGLTGDVDGAGPAVTTSLTMCVIRAAVFFAKTLAIVFVFMWVRWSLPRFRFDQVMQLAWRALIPMSLAQLVMTALVVYYTGGSTSLYGVGGRVAVVLLVANIVLAIVLLFASKFVPAAPDTNRRIRISDSRFDHTPLPAGVVATAPTV